MDGNCEIIALVLGDATDRRWRAGQLGKECGVSFGKRMGVFLE
jgi:hypothetical protein